MADANTPVDTDEVELIIPDKTQEMYPELVQSIQASQSMDNKERNYWLQVLPVMTEEQVDELREILETEKKKLADIEKKYTTPEKETEKTPEEIAEETEKKRQERQERQQAEQQSRAKENIDDILSQLDDL